MPAMHPLMRDPPGFLPSAQTTTTMPTPKKNEKQKYNSHEVVVPLLLCHDTSNFKNHTGSLLLGSDGDGDC